MEVNMKSTATLKSLLVSGLLLLAGASVASAQANNVSSPSVTQAAASYRVTFPETLKGMDARSGVTVGASTDQISITEIKREGSTLMFDVSIPEGTPVGTTVSLVGAGTPLWHVTVADILGNSQSDDVVMLRPLDETHTGSGTGTGNNPNAVAQPAPSTGTSGATVANSVTNVQPEFHLYPNPTVEFVTIVTEGEVLWGVAEVMDPTGKKVLEIPTGASADAGISKFTLNVSPLRAGMYFLRVRVGNDFVTKRFFVSK